MKILVVDDSATIRAIIREELKGTNIQVVEAINGQDALEKLTTTPIELVTLDTEMPHMDGYEFCKIIRSKEFAKKYLADRKDTLPVIIISEYDTADDRARAFQAEATDFLPKPYKQGELLERVKKYLALDNVYHGVTALVVDDTKSIRIIISETLKQQGTLVIEARDGLEAYEIIKNQKQKIDLIISDVEMPNMTGEELVKKIRQELQIKVPIILLSSINDKSKIVNFFKVGATDYIIKPFIKEELLARLNVHLSLHFQYLELEEKGREMNKLNSFIKDALQKYVSPDYINMLISRPDMLDLGGEERELSLMFTDLQGFTSISEMLSPKDLVELLNEYLDGMTNILMRHGGTLDKYEGDAIIAFWNAPLSQNMHAIKAVDAALEMQEFSKTLSAKFEKIGRPALKTRIGINTGKVIVGNIGSKKRFNYTVIGDEVNLASRLEGANKLYGTTLMISETTYQQLNDMFLCRELDFLRVKGKQKPVRVYEVIGRRNQSYSEQTFNMLNLYHQGLAAYQEQNWKEGIRCFAAAIAINYEDNPSITYLERCRFLRDNPPGKNWDKVFTSLTK
jgi:CheY-like chemotaxis protein/class 3 adenylate cyclase